jgi:hypothetical protein
MRRSQEIPLTSNKKARGDEQGRARPLVSALQTALTPHVSHEHALWSGFRLPTFPSFVPQQPVSGADHPQLYQDIQRGLSIDFYAYPNPASWAAFFRDQYLRVATHALEMDSSAVSRTQDYYSGQQQQRQQEVDSWRRYVSHASKVLGSPPALQTALPPHVAREDTPGSAFRPTFPPFVPQLSVIITS